VPTFTPDTGLFGGIPVYASPYIPQDQVLMGTDFGPFGEGRIVMFVGIGKTKKEGRLKRLWRWIKRLLAACEI